MPHARTTPGGAATPATQREVLAVWHDVAPGHAAAVREWYAREHHVERLAVPGFLEARRYDRVAGAGADMFGMYDVSSPQVLADDAVRERLAEANPRTRAVMPYLRNSSVTRCGIAAVAGSAEGGHLATLASPGQGLPRPAALCEQLLAMPGVLRVRAVAARKLRASVKTAESGLREQPDKRIAWALLVDAESAEAAQTALYAARERCGASEVAQCAVYRLAFCARNGG